MIFSLSIGFFGLILTTVFRGYSVSSFDAILAPLAELTVVSLLVYLVFEVAFRYAFKASLLTAHIFIIAFLGMFFVLTGIWIHVNPPRIPFLTKVLPLFIYLVLSFFAAALACLSADKLAASEKIKLFSFALPFLLAEALIVAWIQIFQISPLLSWPSAVVMALYLAASAFTMWSIMRLGTKLRVKLVSLLFIFVVLTPVMIALFKNLTLHSITAEGHKAKISPVILITIDTLRADGLSAFGSTRVKTPNIDQLASDGLVFLNAFSSSSWTLPSLVSLMTGSSPLVHRNLTEESVISENLPTLAERMSASGYHTATAVCNPYISTSGLLRGFQEASSFPETTKSVSASMILSFFESKYDRNYSYTPELTEKTLKLLQKNTSKNLFMWVHYLDPHLPYSPPIAYESFKSPGRIVKPFDEITEIRTGRFNPNQTEREGIRELYDGEVRYVDDHVGKVLEALRKAGLYDRALIVLTSDHGEEFWEHNGYEHGHTIYNELLHVPLIIKLPYSSSKGLMLQRVSTSQIAPTITEICQIKNGKALNSRSILGAKVQKSEEPILASGTRYFDPKIAIMFEHYKYIKNQNTGMEELYDLQTDPAEQITLADTLPEKVLTARKILSEQYMISEDFRKRHKLSDTFKTIDPETANQLRSLGYVQ